MLTEKWKTLKNYAVGETTAKTAEEIGFQVLGKEAGNANALADIIIKCNKINSVPPCVPFFHHINHCCR